MSTVGEPRGAGRTQATPALVTAGLLGVQVVVIVGFIVFFVVEALLGQASEAAAVFTSLFVFVVGAFALAALARGWLRGRRWPRTPTLVWQALLVPIGWSLAQTQHWLVAVAVLAVGIAGFVAAWKTPAESWYPGSGDAAGGSTGDGPRSAGSDSRR